MKTTIRNILVVSAVAAAGAPTQLASARIYREPAGESPARTHSVRAIVVPVDTVQAAQQSVGFEWADAAAGAGGAVVLVGAATACALAVRRRAVHE